MADIPDDELNEIHKFPYPVQLLIADEALAVTGRLEKGKAPPGLVTAECHCRFFTRYLLPCRHIFHEQIYGATKILTAEKWASFQNLFEESGFEIYQSRERVEVEEIQSESVREAEARQERLSEMLERARNQYWRIEEEGNAEMANNYVRNLEVAFEQFLT